MLGGAGVAFGHQLVILVVGLWLTPFLLHRLGQQKLGLWLLAGQVLGYLALTDLGVIAILPREVAFASGRTDGTAASSIAGLLAQVRRIVRWQVVGLSALALVVWWFLPAGWSELRWPLAIVFGAFVMLYPARVPAAALQGAQDLTFMATAQMVGWALSTLTTVVLVLGGFGLYALVLGWVVSVLVPGAAAVYRARQRWPDSRAADPQPGEPVKAYFGRSLWVSMSQVSQVLLNGTDVLVLGRILGAAAVVPYACTGKLVTVLANHPQLVMHAAQPALSELRGSGDRERLATVTHALTHAMLMMSGAIVVMILAMNHLFVTWWVGPEQYGGWGLTAALTGMMLLRHWNVATTYTLFCFGYERQLSLTSLFDGLVTAAAAALLVWQLGPMGAPLGSIIGVLAVSLPYNMASVAREVGQTPLRFLLSTTPVTLRLALVAGCAAAGSLLLPGAPVLPTVGLGVGVGLLYLALMLPLAWHGPTGPYVRIALESFGRRHESAILDRWIVRLVGAKQA